MSDEDALTEMVEAMEAAWNRGDGRAFAAGMTDDVDFIDVLGRHHRGRQVVADGHDQILATFYRGSRMRYTVEGMKFLRPDVAVVHLLGSLSHTLSVAIDDASRDNAAPGEVRETLARPTLVAVKDGQGWRIAASQNTVVAPAPGGA